MFRVVLGRLPTFAQLDESDNEVRQGHGKVMDHPEPRAAKRYVATTSTASDRWERQVRLRSSRLRDCVNLFQHLISA